MTTNDVKEISEFEKEIDSFRLMIIDTASILEDYMEETIGMILTTDDKKIKAIKALFFKDTFLGLADKITICRELTREFHYKIFKKHEEIFSWAKELKDLRNKMAHYFSDRKAVKKDAAKGILRLHYVDGITLKEIILQEKERDEIAERRDIMAVQLNEFAKEMMEDTKK